MKRTVFSFLFFIVCLFSLSQNKPIEFKHLTVQDGLSHSWVKCFLQDKTGYIWVGTADGLNKYNGISFKTYKYNSFHPEGLNHNNINVIYEDRQGNIWVGTQDGLNLYNRNKDEFISIGSIKDYITSIYEFYNGKFLVGTAGGLFLFNTADFTSIQLHTNLFVDKILKDRNNNFWLATSSGLMLLDTINYSVFTIQPDKTKQGSIKGSILKSIFQDSKGGIWIGTGFDGLNYMQYPKNNPREAYFVNYSSDPQNPGSISRGTIYCILEDNNRNLWVGVENGGICVLNLDSLKNGKASFNKITHNPFDFSSVVDNSIHTIYKDRQGTIWIGTFGGGISFYNPLLQRFEHHKIIPGSGTSINNNIVNVIFEEDKYLWIGTEGGLNRYDKKKDEYKYFTNDINNPNSLGSNSVWSIFRDNRKNLWVGVWDGGLNLLNENTNSFTKYYFDWNNPKSISSNNICQIIEDKENNLWIGLQGGGLNRFDTETKTFERYQVVLDKNSISSDWVNGMLESSDGNLWIYTAISVDIFNRKTNHFTSFKNDTANNKSLSYNGAVSVYEDSKSNIWIATSNGLNLFNRADSTFKRYQVADGLSNNSVKAITEDSEGNLWLSTSTVITKFINGINIPDTPVFKNYNINDDKRGFEFKSKSVFKNKQGLIYFGSTNGYYVFNPEEVKDNPHIPDIVFTDLLIYNKLVKAGDQNTPLKEDISTAKKLVLSNKQTVFTIEFASLSFLAPENNQYAFYLEGFESTWNYVGQQRSATYTNLDPGKYIFRVKASNNDGLWNEEGISLKIVILPAWWQTWAFKIIMIIIILIAIYYFRKHTLISVNLKNALWKEHLEKEKTEELNQLKNQFFANISHELRTPLTLIIGPLKKLITEKNNPEILGTIYRNATRLKTLVDQIMDFSKVESHMMKLNFERKDIVESIESVLHNFSEYAGQKNISLIFKSKLERCIANIDEDKLEKIIANIVSNAIKNTPENGKITVDFGYNSKSKLVEINIADTGRGIPAEEINRIFERFYTGSNSIAESTGTGIGLNLTRKLIELYKGTIAVSSIVGRGTTFFIELPLSVYEMEEGIFEKSLSDAQTVKNVQLTNTNSVEFKFEKTILVIDDNPEMCDFIESILNENFNIIKEYNPLEAINSVIKNLPDLIISDVMMPEVDGFELCLKIKSDLRFSHIPVILLTAKTSTSDQITGFETGADDYIYKPFEGELLLARVKNLIAQKENLRRYFIGSDGIINPKTNANNLDIAFVDEVLIFISQQYSDPDFNVNNIIDRLGMSRSIFYKKFKALSNQSVNDLIRNFRLKKAVELLSNSHYSVSQVAYDCGFSDPAYFSKVFKEHYKISPKDYTSGGSEIK